MTVCESWLFVLIHFPNEKEMARNETHCNTSAILNLCLKIFDRRVKLKRVYVNCGGSTIKLRGIASQILHSSLWRQTQCQFPIAKLV